MTEKRIVEDVVARAHEQFEQKFDKWILELEKETKMRDTDTDSTQEIEQQDLKRIMGAHGPNITVVHSGESLTIKWNPVTHKEVRNETADGGIILTVQPQDR